MMTKKSCVGWSNVEDNEMLNFAEYSSNQNILLFLQSILTKNLSKMAAAGDYKSTLCGHSNVGE